MPLEAHPPFPVNPNAELALTIAPQSLKTIAGQHLEGFERIGGVQQAEPFLGLPRETLKLPNPIAIKKPLGAAVFEASNHANI